MHTLRIRLPRIVFRVLEQIFLLLCHNCFRVTANVPNPRSLRTVETTHLNRTIGWKLLRTSLKTQHGNGDKGKSLHFRFLC